MWVGDPNWFCPSVPDVPDCLGLGRKSEKLEKGDIYVGRGRDLVKHKGESVSIDIYNEIIPGFPEIRSRSGKTSSE